MATAQNQEENWTTVITPQRHLLDIDLKGVWQYRDLIWLFVKRDFAAIYKQTILGPLWYFARPLMVALTYTLFGAIASIETDGVPRVLFNLAGVVMWSYFSTCLTSTSNSFVANMHIFGKVYFPRLVIPVSVVISNLVSFGLQLLLFSGFLVFYLITSDSVHLTAYAFLFPVFIVMMAAFGLGLGLIVSALSSKYRDLIYLVTFGAQLFMFATPVIYPVSMIYSNLPETLHWVVYLNPMVPVIEGFRMGFLGNSSFSMEMLFVSGGVIAIVLVIGIIIFNKVEKSFIDTI